MTSLRFAVVGAGRLGASLALALKAKGLRLVAYSCATSAGRLRAEALLGDTASATLEDVISRQPDLYLLCVPDSALLEVSADLATLLDTTHERWVAHTSGSTSVDALRPCALAGATTFKFHPLQTFAESAEGYRLFTGAAVAVTPDAGGEASPAAHMAFALARLLEAKPFLLADKDRVLYHAAATLACNYFVTLEHLARDLFVRAGLPPEKALCMFLPLVSGTLANLRSKGAVASLTGPLSRGDLVTVGDHLATLTAEADSVVPIYRELGLATLDIVRARGDIAEERIEELAALLAGPEATPAT